MTLNGSICIFYINSVQDSRKNSIIVPTILREMGCLDASAHTTYLVVPLFVKPMHGTVALLVFQTFLI